MSEIIGVPPPALELMPAVFPFPALGYRVLGAKKREKVMERIGDLIPQLDNAACQRL